jgi:NAD(P)-dependent dehydrogenase (short-subunit alcohol dehydrogenase family)
MQLANTSENHRPSTTLSGHSVVVVGGSSGIGLEVARQARQAGAELTLLGRSAERLQAAAQAIGGARQQVADIASGAGLEQAFATLTRIDHLVITAGTVRLLPLKDSRAEDLRQIADERLVGPLLAIQAALPRMAPQGSITLMSGQLAARPMPLGAMLAGAVAAVEILARSLALELAPLRVNAVAPGVVDTPLLAQLFGESSAETVRTIAAKLPVKRIGNAEEVARAVLFLMEGGYISGEVLHLDGGGRWV